MNFLEPPTKSNMEYTSKNVLERALSQFFNDNFYKDAVVNLRRALKANADYKNHWEGVIRLVVNRELAPGEPLNLIHQSANLPLDENSDEEAYKWLSLMLINSMGAEDANDYRILMLRV